MPIDSFEYPLPERINYETARELNELDKAFWAVIDGCVGQEFCANYGTKTVSMYLFHNSTIHSDFN